MIHDIEDVLRHAIPDLRNIPAYVIFASEQSDLLTCTGFRGWSGKQFDLTIRPSLTEQGLWHGRGPAIFINDTLIEQDVRASGIREERIGTTILEAVGACVVHEFAHALESEFDLSLPTTRKCEIAAERTEVAAGLWGSFSDDIPNFFGHEMTLWGRMALHLHDRFWRMNLRLPLPYIFGNREYGIDPWNYRLALADEFKTLRKASFAEIRATPPPREFIQQWRNDVISIFHSRPTCHGRWGQICIDELSKYADPITA